MTIRSVILDHRYSASGDCGYQTDVGLYYHKIQSGGDTPNDHSHENSYTLDLLSTANPLVRYKYPQDSYYYNNCIIPGFTDVAPLSLTANDELTLINKLADGIRGSSFNAAISLGEGGKTLQMIGDRARGLYQALRSFRNGDYNATAHHLGISTPPRSKRKRYKSSSDIAANRSFLEFEYGWRPFMNDIKEGAEYIFHKTNKPISTTYRSHVWRERKLFNGTYPTIQVGTAKIDCWYRTRVSDDWKVWEELGLTDIPSLAWELTPYSFVADWVLPVGKYLNARQSASLIKTPVWSTVLSKVQAATNFVAPDVYADGIRSHKRVNMSRQPVNVSSNAMPLPSFRGFEDIASWKHAVDGVALLIGAGAFYKKT